MNKEIRVQNKVISNDSLFIIAEVGNQFAGSLEKAKALCEAAKKAGTDAVKFIFWFPDEIYADNPEYTYETTLGKKTEPIRDLLNRLRLTLTEWYEVQLVCDKLGIIMLSTINSASGFDWVIELGLPAFKLSSWDWDYTDLWRWCAKTGLPIIADMGPIAPTELERNLAIFNEYQNRDLVLLHCFHTQNIGQVNMKTISYLRSHCLTGYSSAGRENTTDIISLALGGCVLEKRLTLNRSDGILHDAVSLEPDEFAEYVKTMRTVKVMLGKGLLTPSSEDVAMRKKYFRRIVASEDIVQGMPILRTQLNAVRGETGISPEYMDDFVGKTAKRNIRRNEDVDYSII